MAAFEKEIPHPEGGYFSNNPKRILPESLARTPDLYFNRPIKLLNYIVNHPDWLQNFDELEILSALIPQMSTTKNFGELISIVQGMIFQIYALDVVKSTNNNGVLLDQNATQKLIQSVQMLSPSPTMHLRAGNEFVKKREQKTQSKHIRLAEEDFNDELDLPSNLLNRILRPPKQKTPKLISEYELEQERKLKANRRKSAKVHLYLPGPLKTRKYAWNPDGFIINSNGTYTILECVCYNPDSKQDRFDDYCKKKFDTFYNSQVKYPEFLDARLRFIVPRHRELPGWLEDAVDNPHSPLEKQEVPSPYMHFWEVSNSIAYEHRKHNDPHNETLWEIWERYK